MHRFCRQSKRHADEHDAVANSQPVFEEYSRLMLISDELEEYDKLVQAVKYNAGIATVIVHYDGMTLDSLLAKIHAKVGHKKGKLLSVALLDHGSKAEFRLLNGHDVDFKHLTMSEDGDTPLGKFFKEVASYCDPHKGNLDILACNVAEGKEGRAFVEQLKKITGIDVNASDDATGCGEEVEGGFDWILESGNVDAAALYFDASKLRLWQHHMRGRVKLPPINPKKMVKSLGDIADALGVAQETLIQYGHVFNVLDAVRSEIIVRNLSKTSQCVAVEKEIFTDSDAWTTIQPGKQAKWGRKQDNYKFWLTSGGPRCMLGHKSGITYIFLRGNDELTVLGQD